MSSYVRILGIAALQREGPRSTDSKHEPSRPNVDELRTKVR